ncbi:MAG TPA: histidine phosphatase family protein [Acidimicrobiia bacterium]|nr:histidine phosphatase family protein [Acidimicrobiia bacterium]
MARMVLVRHAEPDASWGEHPDPGLSRAGSGQAEATVGRLAAFEFASVVTSPLRRARETAAPLETHRGVTARIEPQLGEIVTPPGVAASRPEWLRAVLGGHWAEVDPDVHRWRAAVLETVRATTGTVIAFTHFVAINVVVGAATRDDRVWVCSPGHASITVIDVDGSDLTVAALGDQTLSRVQ